MHWTPRNASIEPPRQPVSRRSGGAYAQEITKIGYDRGATNAKRIVAEQQALVAKLKATWQSTLEAEGTNRRAELSQKFH